MQELDVKYYPDEDYRELFVTTVDSRKCTDESVGITKDGKLLYIKEELRNSGNAYYMSREFFSIDRDEFCHYLSMARASGKVAQAIKNGHTTEEELAQLSHK